MMWFLFGWGKRTKIFDLGDGRQVIALWPYFHFFFFPVVTGSITYHLQGALRSEDREISEPEAAQLLGQKIDIGAWNRFGLLIGLGIVIVILIASAISPWLFLLLIPLFGYGIGKSFPSSYWKKRFAISSLCIFVLLYGTYLYGVFYGNSGEQALNMGSIGVDVVAALVFGWIIVLVWKAAKKQ